MIRCVGERVDWLSVTLIDAVFESVEIYLAKRGAVAVQHGSASVEIDGWSGCLLPPRDGKYLITNARERVTIWPKAPGGTLRADGQKTPGWTVKVEVSGVELLEAGWRDAVRRAWQIAARIGVVDAVARSRRRRRPPSTNRSGISISTLLSLTSVAVLSAPSETANEAP